MKIDNNRYVNEAALLADLTRYANQVDYTGTLTSMLQHIVLDQKDRVYLVRCNECRHWDTDWEPKYAMCGEHFCAAMCRDTTPDWFCADGEPRT